MRILVALIIALTLTASVCPALAQPGPGGNGGPTSGDALPHGINPRSTRSISNANLFLLRTYNPKTVTAATGAVESLGTLPPHSKLDTAIRSAVLKTQQSKITVFLGPDWYLKEQNLALKVGDQLAATGSKITLAGKPAIIVKDFKLGGKTYPLRDVRGVPVWLEHPPAGRPAK